MIETDTNVHLFLHEDSMRQLIIKKDDVFKLSKSDITYNSLLYVISDLLNLNTSSFLIIS
jgi:uncharacterized protein YllA (UPF0747 family)